jgi:hypothetical protein
VQNLNNYLANFEINQDNNLSNKDNNVINDTNNSNIAVLIPDDP